MILVDTPVWSLALRRKRSDLAPEEMRTVDAFSRMIEDGRVELLGAVRQELLSGLREDAQFRKLRDYLRDFPDANVSTPDYEEAAHSNNRCRQAGIAASPTDMLLCAIAIRHKREIFTTDRDFTNYSRVLPFHLVPIR
jgi:predicted nucleic acid-binding protein